MSDTPGYGEVHNSNLDDILEIAGYKGDRNKKWLPKLNHSEEFFDEVHKEALKWRQEKRRQWLEGELPLEDFSFIAKMEGMFPNDVWECNEQEGST